MKTNRLNKLISVLFNTILILLFGVLVYAITSLILNKSVQKLTAYQKRFILEEDSCFIKYSEKLDMIDSISGDIILYLETEPCATCSEQAIMNVVYSIIDSCQIKPMLLYHPIEAIDSQKINDYYSRFDKKMRVLVSMDDSIMIKNNWMPKFLGYYGIVIDSSGLVCYAGTLFDDRFLKSCIKHFGI